nr:hypothetical protein [Cressdnaviricota sp.]UOF82857.1 hypothetical protein [Cressdnaviricota sp.]
MANPDPVTDLGESSPSSDITQVSIAKKKLSVCSSVVCSFSDCSVVFGREV